MAEKRFTAGRLPDAGSAYRNCAMLHPQDFNALFPSGKGPAYIELQSLEGQKKTMILLVEPHPGAKVGQLGLSVLLRKCTGVSENFEVAVKPFIPKNRPKEKLASVSFEVNLLRDDSHATVLEVKLAPIVKKVLQGHMLNRGQLLCFDLEGEGIHLTVKGCEVPSADASREDLIESSNFGIFCDFTNVAFTPAKNKKLNWQPQSKGFQGFNYREMKIGGLDREFDDIFRRAFVSRTFPPYLMEQMGRKHVKGLLLYGPPGTGKTLIARQIGKMLSEAEPIIVNGPEVMNKYVGASEENIRKLFEPAEKDYKANKENAQLHIIIFDEIDAICKQRGTAGGGTGVHDTMVNQLLTKIDGVDPLPNILVIGMTNRKDLIDSALVRPGRLEVLVEIGLPDKAGRLQILRIHTEKMSGNNFLGEDVDLDELAELTKNFSGAEIEGLVNAATSFALYGCVKVKNNVVVNDFTPEELAKIRVTMDDFYAALDEVRPAFGVAETDLAKYLPASGAPLVDWGPAFAGVLGTLTTLRNRLQQSALPLLSVLLEGPSGVGKTALAAQVALGSGYPFVKIVSADQLVSQSEQQRCATLNKVFDDAGKSPLSFIILDNLERLIDYVPVGPRFSNAVLQTLMVLISKIPDNPSRKIFVVATTSDYSIFQEMQFDSVFNVVLSLPELTEAEHVVKFLETLATQETPEPDPRKSRGQGSRSKPRLIELENSAPAPSTSTSTTTTTSSAGAAGTTSSSSSSSSSSNTTARGRRTNLTAKQLEEIRKIAGVCPLPISVKRLLVVMEVANVSDAGATHDALERGVPNGQSLLLYERFLAALNNPTYRSKRAPRNLGLE